MGRWLGRGLGIVFGVMLVVQVVPYGRDHTNPPVAADAPWPTPEARTLARAACYDCHSNETAWPWYSHVAPMSWLVERDVDRGRKELNFSHWPSGDVDKLAESVEDGEMPPRHYLFAHPAARLTPAEKARLLAALRQLEALARGEDEAGSEPDGEGDGEGEGG